MTATFYDELAPYFHLLYGDWERAILKQGAAISSLLGEFGIKSGDRVLDAACGIGGELKRLRFELSSRSLHAQLHLDDLRTLAHAASGSMAAILACDNSIPHLLFSVRDYAAIERKTPDVRPYGMRYLDGDRFLAVQVWEWDKDQYDLRLYLTREFADGRCEARVLRSRYYAVSIARLCELLLEAGFVEVQRRDHVLHQPVLVGRRAA